MDHRVTLKDYEQAAILGSFEARDVLGSADGIFAGGSSMGPPPGGGPPPPPPVF